MSATDYPPRCKDKNNLAKNVQCEPIFLQKYLFFSIFGVFAQKNMISQRKICYLKNLFYAVKNFRPKPLVSRLTMKCTFPVRHQL